jgi:hypothetical protein
VPTVSALSLEEWMAEFERLKRVNGEIMGKRGKETRRNKGSTP